MRRINVTIPVAVFLAIIVQARAESCRLEIARLETIAREPNTQPYVGATDRQTIGAQLHHQPTAASVSTAEHQATSDVEKLLADARNLDAANKEADCMNAVARAKLLLGVE